MVKVFNRIYNVYRDLGMLTSAPKLFYNASPVINAYAAQGNQIVIYLALTELLQDSDAELAFVIAHELGHIVQQRENALWFVPDNPEFDADVWSVLVCLVAGFDPYSGSGSLAKLSMATGHVGLAQQFEDQASDDAHKSFVSRIEIMYDVLTAVCGINEDFRSACDGVKSKLHPHFPSKAVI
jgi:predicted Zn-dependent protease